MSMSLVHNARKMSALRSLLACVFFSAVLLCLLFPLATVASAAAPPQAPQLPQAPEIPACGCGCMTPGVPCLCKNCCERTADLNWKPSQSAKAVATVASTPRFSNQQYDTVQVCGPNGCQMAKVPRSTGPRTYGDFIYDPQTEQPAGQAVAAPQQSPSQGFVRTPLRPIKNLIGRIQQRRSGGTMSPSGCSSCGN